MDAISIRCKACQHAMKFSADKAGKKAKCPKCGTIVAIQAEPAPPPAPTPAEDPDAITLAPMPENVQTQEEANKKTEDLFDDGGPATYEATVDPELVARQQQMAEEEEAKKTAKKVRKKLPKVGRKVKALPDAEAWKKIRVGLFLISIACWIWLASHLLVGSYVLLGWTEFTEYAQMVAKNVSERRGANDFPDRGKFWEIDELSIYLEMISGRDWLGFARFALTLSTVLYFLQAVLWAAGYGFCVPVPRRFGMFGQVIGMLVLAVLNILLILFFKLLPVLGAHGYILIPYVVPEICLTSYNVERTVPIHILWSGEPFWENLLTLIIRGIQYLEPTIGCIFIWSTGVAIKSPEIEKGGRRLTYMSFGVLFTLLCFHVLSLAGGSGVLVIVLRIVYALWFGGLLLFILNYAMLLLKTRAVLEEKINPRFELRE
jgi:hypothetical protein